MAGQLWPIPATQTGLLGEQCTEMAATLTHLQLQDLLLEGSCFGLQRLPLLLLLPCHLRLLHQLLAHLAELLPELGQLCVLPAR